MRDDNFAHTVQTGLERAASQHQEVLAEVLSDGGALQFYPAKEKKPSSILWSFRVINDSGTCRVYYQGLGGTKLEFGPDVSDLTEEWIFEQAAAFIRDTLRDLRVE